MVCTISGLCSDALLIQTDPDADVDDIEEEAEILSDKGRFGTYLSLSRRVFCLFSYLQHRS